MREKFIKYFKFVWLFAMLVLLYFVGVPIFYLPIIGIIFLFILLAKEKSKKGIDNFVSKHFPFLENSPNWLKRFLVIAIFIFIYFIFKQIIYYILGLFGIDIEGMILEITQKYQ